MDVDCLTREGQTRLYGGPGCYYMQCVDTSFFGLASLLGERTEVLRSHVLLILVGANFGIFTLSVR